MNGSELRDARTELGWSRHELAEKTGLTLHRIAVIEQGKRPPEAHEVEAIRQVLRSELTDVLVQTGEHEVIVIPEEEVRSGSWNGVQRGDEVKITGEKGRFRFLYHHRDDHQEYVQVFGPVAGSVPRARNPKASHERSVRPDRVRPA